MMTSKSLPRLLFAALIVAAIPAPITRAARLGNAPTPPGVTFPFRPI